jgi:hypothetical protein
VVRNRLEQLRKRQRDEALQAQKELLAGVERSSNGSSRPMPVEVAVAPAQKKPMEEVEPYDRSMSPPLLDIRKLYGDEREIDIVTAKENLRQLVSDINLVPSTV